MKKYIPCYANKYFYSNKNEFIDGLNYFFKNYNCQTVDWILKNSANYHFYIEVNDSVDEMWKEYREKYILRDIIK
jgi:hypothetical protein